MAFFEFPHTRTYDTDLGWLINAFNEISEKLDTYLENAVIKFADPITWDITEQYTALTCVIDSDGTAYLSKQPVPAGVDISNTDYWLPIFNYDDNINTLRSQIAYNALGSPTTGQALAAGDLVFWNGLIYKVLVDMAAGTAFIDGTNITQYTVDQKIDDVASEIDTVRSDITAIQNDITNINTEIEYLEAEPVNVLTLGIKNDGSEDISAIFNAETLTKQLYFPTGVYLVKSPLIMYNSVYGASSPKIAGRGTVFKADIPGMLTDTYILNVREVANSEGLEVNNITFDCDSLDYVGGINYAPVTDVSGRPPFKLTNCVVNNTGAYVYALRVAPTGNISRGFYVSNFASYGGSDNTAGGIFINDHAMDCMFENLELMYAKNGIRCNGSTCRFYNAQIYGGRAGIADPATYYASAIGMDMSASFFADNIYLDTFYQMIVQRAGNGVCGHIIAWCDTAMNTSGLTQGTMFRAVPKSTLTIDTVETGGAATARARFAVILGNRVNVGRMINCEWSTIEERYPGQFPGITPNYSNKSYQVKASHYGANGRYMLFAIIYAGDAGYTDIRCCRDDQILDIHVKRSTASAITIYGTYVSNAVANMPVYYKQSGNYIYLYAMQYGNGFNVETIYSTMRGEDVRTSVSPADFSALPAYELPSQADTSGLTPVTAS